MEILDVEEEPIIKKFDKCFDFINEAILKREGILVHWLEVSYSFYVFLNKTYYFSLLVMLEFQEVQPLLLLI